MCRNHGGAITRVKLAAADRLREMVDPLLDELFRIAMSGESDAVRLSAVRDALDRAGYKPTEKVEQSGAQTIRVEYARADKPMAIDPRSLSNGHDHPEDS